MYDTEEILRLFNTGEDKKFIENIIISKGNQIEDSIDSFKKSYVKTLKKSKFEIAIYIFNDKENFIKELNNYTNFNYYKKILEYLIKTYPRYKICIFSTGNITEFESLFYDNVYFCLNKPLKIIFNEIVNIKILISSKIVLSYLCSLLSDGKIYYIPSKHKPLKLWKNIYNIVKHRKIYTWWTGENDITENRKRSLKSLYNRSGVDIIFITNQNLKEYILESEPLHSAYKYLSFTQRGDYLKAYFMNFYGGGYSDIKETTGDWNSSFDKLDNSDKWIIGYKELCPDDVAYRPVANYWYYLIGNGAYICKPGTSLTKEWYREMLVVLDKKLELLKRYPAVFPQDCSEVSNKKYPIGWNEINGRIFHKICYKYKDKLINTLPTSIFSNYR